MTDLSRCRTLELLAIWALLAALGALTAAAVLGSGLRFVNAAPFFANFGGLVAALVAINVYQRVRMPENRRTIFFLDMVAIYVSAAVLMMIYQYALATFSATPISAAIERADHAVGFRWFDYASTVARYPWLSAAMQFCYTSWMREFVIALAVMTYLRKFDEIAEFTFAYLIAGFATLSVTAFLDAKSYEAVAAYAVSGIHHAVGVSPEYLAKLEALRAGADRTLDFGHVIGLVAFPSFHGGSALLLSVATRSLRGLWLPFLVFNELILVGVLSEGGHNLMDLVGGCVFAIAALAAAQALRRALARSVAAEPALALSGV